MIQDTYRSTKGAITLPSHVLNLITIITVVVRLRVLLTFEVIVLCGLVVPEAKVVAFLCVALDPDKPSA